MIKGFAALAVFGVALTGCGNGGNSQPEGQVAATVNGREITISELDFTTGKMTGTPEELAAARQQALQGIIARYQFVDAAREEKLDKTPTAALITSQAEDGALVQLLYRKFADGVPKVSDDEVATFISSHPLTFSQRKLIFVDQLVVPKMTKEVFDKLKPMKSIADAEALLRANNLRFIRGAGVVDTLRTNPETSAQILGVDANDIFITPNGNGGFEISAITSSRTEPIMGAEATEMAREIMNKQRVDNQVKAAMGKILKDGQSTVKINPAYAPKKPSPKV